MIRHVARPGRAGTTPAEWTIVLFGGLLVLLGLVMGGMGSFRGGGSRAGLIGSIDPGSIPAPRRGHE
jgi:hypothetical protein